MRRAKGRWLLISTALLVLVTHAAAVAPFKKVSIATSTAAPPAGSSTTTIDTEADTAPEAVSEIKSENTTTTGRGNSKLTGIPQIDYIWDPNLPRELHGYNLSTYPFFSTVPPDEDIHFKCDGLHDGFYASIEFKCQVYHHCVYGIRHDFLCANFTAFDQKTFICHFASDVDCAGSKKYWSKNDLLYMATTTSTIKPTTAEPTPPPAPARRRPYGRPQRPLRRPINRRPVDDYYYEDEEYDDDYYEERLNRRRKQRPRHRKPQVVSEYDDEYDDKRSFGDDDRPRRPNSRDHPRADEEELDEDYDSDRRKYDRPKSRNKPATAADRRKSAAGRRPGTIGSSRPSADERRSFSDDRPSLNGRKEKPKPAIEEQPLEPVDTQPRRLAGRRRISEKRTSPTPAAAADSDDLDVYEKPRSRGAAGDQEDAADEDNPPPKVKTTPKPLEEFITPKAAPASVYARPRAPPRIARPVPVNEKNKFKYPVQKTGTTASPDAAAEDEEYYEDSEYEDARGQQKGQTRRRIVDGAASKFEDDDVPATRKRNHNNESRKPTRTTLRKPVTDKKPLTAEEEDYDSPSSASSERFDSRGGSGRRRPYSSRPRPSVSALSGRVGDDVDFVDDDYEERPQRPAHRLRPKVAARKSPKKPRLPVEEEETEDDIYEPEPEPERRKPAIANQSRRNKFPNLRPRASTPAAPPAPEDEDLESDVAEDDSEVPTSPAKTLPTSPAGRTPSVRVVKRPFLPSRGGSPYLPRGLQPVGLALKPFIGGGAQTTDSTPFDMGSTISGVRLLEHGAPILRGDSYETGQPGPPPRTTLPPRSAIPVSQQTRAEPPVPKISLDELYENDYDVTLNDALNPTLKPLSPLPGHLHNRNYASEFLSSAPAANTFVNNNQSPANHNSLNNNNNNNNNYQQQHHPNAYQSVPNSSPQLQSHHQQLQQQQQSQQHQPINNYNSDSYFSSTDIRRRAIIAAPPPARSSRTDYRGVGTRIAQHFYDDIEY